MRSYQIYTTHDALAEWAGVFNGTEYAMPQGLTFKTVLDIGACHGAYTTWALREYPEATFICFEPNPESWPYLRKNLADNPRVTLVNAAVGDTAGQTELRQVGNGNFGEWAVEGADTAHGTLEGGRHHKVFITSITRVPPAELVKIDTEGSELTILQAMLGAWPEKPKGIVMEYHRADDMAALVCVLTDHGYSVACSPRGPNYGTLRGWLEPGGALNKAEAHRLAHKLRDPKFYTARKKRAVNSLTVERGPKGGAA